MEMSQLSVLEQVIIVFWWLNLLQTLHIDYSRLSTDNYYLLDLVPLIGCRCLKNMIFFCTKSSHSSSSCRIIQTAVNNVVRKYLCSPNSVHLLQNWERNVIPCVSLISAGVRCWFIIVTVLTFLCICSQQKKKSGNLCVFLSSDEKATASLANAEMTTCGFLSKKAEIWQKNLPTICVLKNNIRIAFLQSSETDKAFILLISAFLY